MSDQYVDNLTASYAANAQELKRLQELSHAERHSTHTQEVDRLLRQQQRIKQDLEQCGVAVS